MTMTVYMHHFYFLYDCHVLVDTALVVSCVTKQWLIGLGTLVMNSYTVGRSAFVQEHILLFYILLLATRLLYYYYGTLNSYNL